MTVKMNGSMDWIVKVVIGALVGIILTIGFGEFLPQVKGVAKLEQKVENVIDDVRESERKIDEIQKLIIEQGVQTRALFRSVIDDHRSEGMQLK